MNMNKQNQFSKLYLARKDVYGCSYLQCNDMALKLNELDDIFQLHLSIADISSKGLVQLYYTYLILTYGASAEHQTGLGLPFNSCIHHTESVCSH